MLDDVIQVYIERAHKVLPSKAKILVGLDHDKFLSRLLELGNDYLEETKTFAFLFDTTPQDLIMSEMKDYKDIINNFPNSNRIADRALYIGNYYEQDWISIVNQCLSGWFGTDDYEIVEWVR